jgi:hypothetical protein
MAPRSPPRKIHWRVPTVIIVAFIAGLAFALGHHAFYDSLDGQPVDGHLFGQQINLAVGQAFAFLVRASLVISVGASYWQVFWGTVLHGSLVISQVDALAGMLGSILDLLNFKASTSRPVLVALALLSWMVPLASILPPATLSVHNTTRTESKSLRVPVPHFDVMSMAVMNSFGLNYDPPVADGPYDGQLWSWSEYLRPSRQLLRLVASTAYQGAVPDHYTTFPNSTYTLGFPAPAMRCEVIPEDLLLDFNDAMNCSLILDESIDVPKAKCENLVTYLSWVPIYANLIPFKSGSLVNGTMPLESRHSTFNFDYRYIGGLTGAPASLHLASKSQRLPYDFNNWDHLNCSIYNASYSVDVTSDSNSRGVLSKPKVRALNSVPFNITSSKRPTMAPIVANESAAFAYLALMESFNRLVVGTIFGSWFATSSGTKYYREEELTVQNEAFTQTLLPFTTELLPFLGDFYYPDGQVVDDPPNVKQWTRVDTFDGNIISYPKEAFSSSTFNHSLASVLEELFRNMTLSLLSAEAFVEPSAEDIKVAYKITQNTYAYDSRNLFVSYGMAVSFALIAGIAGCASILSNGASYSNRFSTVLRTTRGQELEELVVHNDRTGVDPLPEHLEKSRIDLRRGQVESQHDVDTWRPENVSEQTSMIGISRSDGQVSASSEQEVESIDHVPTSVQRFNTL